jgi:hypothetical protein
MRHPRKKTVDTAVGFLTELARRQFSGTVELVFQDGGIRSAHKIRTIREPVGQVLAGAESEPH